MAANFDFSLVEVSKHLGKLEAAGLVRREKVGRQVFFTALRPPLDAALAEVERYRAFWQGSFDRLAAALAEEEFAPTKIQTSEPATL